MKTIKLLFLLFIFTHCGFAQIVTFQKAISDIPDTPCGIFCQPYAVVNDIKETYDHGFIVTGFIGNFEALLKLDSNGDTIWTKHFLPNGPLVGYSVLQTCDSGYITYGIGIDKTDKDGNVIWSKNYPDAYSPASGFEGSIAITNDCGYILANSTDSFGAGGFDMYIIKTDTGGNPLWGKTYGGAGDDEATSIQQTNDDGYIIAGFTNSFDTTGFVAYLIKTDANGDTLWTKNYGPGLGVSYRYSVKQTFDKGYILLGGYLIKTDSVGNVMWAKQLRGNYIQQTNDSGYIFVTNNGFLTKVNSTGNLLWSREFPASYQVLRWASGVLQTNDGGYMAADYAQVTANLEDQDNINLNKTDANGHSGCNEIDTTFIVDSVSIIALGTVTVVTSPVTTVIASSVSLGTESMNITTACSTTSIPEQRTENSLTIYPNPVAPDGCISIFLNEDMNGAEVTIFNTLGEVLYSEVVNGTGQMILLQLKGKLSTGMYFVRIKQGDNICVQKIVVMG